MFGFFPTSTLQRKRQVTLESVANSNLSCALSDLGLVCGSWSIWCVFVLFITQVRSAERSWVLSQLHCCLFDAWGFWRRPTPATQASESWRELSVWFHTCRLQNVVVFSTTPFIRASSSKSNIAKNVASPWLTQDEDNGIRKASSKLLAIQLCECLWW